MNVIAPEHLELITDDAEALVPLVRNAGAVFVGPWAPAAVGDYVAGVNHVLPTARTARFASALRVDTFRKHIHVVRVVARGPRRGRRARRGAGDRRGSSRARPERRAPPVGGVRRGRAMSDTRVRPLVAPRDDLGALEGYHSPQLDVSVRLNTNESPYPPPPSSSTAGWPSCARSR